MGGRIERDVAPGEQTALPAPSAEPTLAPSAASAMLALQRSAGNRAVTALLGRRAPSAQVARDPTRKPNSKTEYVDPDYPTLELVEVPPVRQPPPSTGESGGTALLVPVRPALQEFAIKDSGLRVYWNASTRRYYQDADGTREFNVLAHVAPELTEWTQTFESVTTASAGAEPKLRSALGMYLCQMFYTNAFYRADEIARLDYQTTPLNLQEGGGYLRGEVTAFVTALKQLLPPFAAKEVVPVRSMDFRAVLGQLMSRIEITAESNLTADGLHHDIATLVDETIAQWLVKERDLSKYEKSQPLTFVDLTPLLEHVPPAQLKTKAAKFADDLTNTVFDRCRHVLIEKVAVDLNLPARELELYYKEKGKLTNLKAFLELLRKRYAATFEEHKQQEAESVAAGEGVNPSQEKAKFIGWLKTLELDPGSDEAHLVELWAAQKKDFEAINALYEKLTKTARFREYLAGPKAKEVMARPLTDQTVADYLRNELAAPLTKLIATAESQLPMVICMGGVVKVEKQPLLLAPGISTHMMSKIKGILGKTGYTPTPTSVTRGLLERPEHPVPLQELVALIIESQLELERHESGNERVLGKLRAVLSHVRGFKPSQQMPVPELKGRLEQTRHLFDDFAKLATSNLAYVSILTRSMRKLIEHTGVLDPDLLPAVALERLNQNLAGAIETAGQIEQFTRHIQNMHELVLLALELKPPALDWQKDVLPKDSPLQGQLQGVQLTDYALKAFTEVYNATIAQHGAADSFNVEAYASIYYELVEKMHQTQGASGGRVHVTTPGSVETRAPEMGHEEPQLVMIDIHPNDAAKMKMKANDVAGLIDKLFPADKRNRCTVILDVTLSHLLEREVTDIKKHCDPLIQSGRLNLVILQSVTKFAQFGMDKHSGGLMLFYNKPEEWQTFNAHVGNATKVDVVDQTIENYFKVLFKYTAEEQAEYLEKVRSNYRYVYTNLERALKAFGLKRPALALTLNEDPQSCYVAFNYEEFAARVFGIGAVTDENVHELNMDVLNEAVYKMVKKARLPLSMRMSFGFPISNLGETGRTIRFTIGLEEHEMLNSYLAILTHINRELTLVVPRELADPDKRSRILDLLTREVGRFNYIKKTLDEMFA